MELSSTIGLVGPGFKELVGAEAGRPPGSSSFYVVLPMRANVGLFTGTHFELDESAGRPIGVPGVVVVGDGARICSPATAQA